jgi:hypothetical protein
MAQARWTNILRYAHCDPLDAGAPWDGVALLWYRDEAARLSHVADAGARATMRADEAETFARPVRMFSTLVEEVRVSGDGRAPFRHFVFLWRAPGIDRAAFQARLRDGASRRGEALARIAGFRGLSLDLARAEAGLDGFGHDCDAIEESGWDGAAPVPPPRAPWIARAEALATRHVPLWEAGAQA